jgi:hypothetical protein
MSPKNVTESKLVWFGVLQLLIGLAGGLPEIVAFVQKFTAENPVDWSDAGQVVPWVLMLVSGIITIVLRAITKQPITLK